MNVKLEGDAIRHLNQVSNYRQVLSWGSALDLDRVKRLTVEALEVAFYLCNATYERYGLTKLFDIMNQILPSAYVLNTSYWVFYSATNGRSICVCSRFGLRCPHYRNVYHWVNMEPKSESQEAYYFASQKMKATSTEPYIIIQPIQTGNLTAYELNIRLKVQIYFVGNGERFTPTPDMTTNLQMSSKYYFTKEYYPLENVIVHFRPTPMEHPNYGKYFPKLKSTYVELNTFGPHTEVSHPWTFVLMDMPRFIIINNAVVHPIYKQLFNNPFVNNLPINCAKLETLDPLSFVNPQQRDVNGVSYFHDHYGNARVNIAIPMNTMEAQLFQGHLWLPENYNVLATPPNSPSPDVLPSSNIGRFRRGGGRGRRSERGRRGGSRSTTRSPRGHVESSESIPSPVTTPCSSTTPSPTFETVARSLNQISSITRTSIRVNQQVSGNNGNLSNSYQQVSNTNLMMERGTINVQTSSDLNFPLPGESVNFPQLPPSFFDELTTNECLDIINQVINEELVTTTSVLPPIPEEEAVATIASIYNFPFHSSRN